MTQSKELTIFEDQLTEMTPQFDEALGRRMPPSRLIRTLVICCSRVPDLLECHRQSLINASLTFGVLALEVDGVTGQGYILPFKRVAQPVIGYKGYNTIGARSGLTITAGVAREGDDFDWAKGSSPFVMHKGKGGAGPIKSAWSVAAANDRPPVVEVLSIDELMAIKAKSPGSRKADSPWNDPTIGFPAMCEKSARRRLARSTPMNWATPEFNYAAVMETAFEEQGRHAYILPGRGPVVEGEAGREEPPSGGTPLTGELIGPKEDPEITALKIEGKEAAEHGIYMLQTWWGRLSPRQRVSLIAHKDDVLKPMAAKADKGESNAN